jgi:hypothetical protein
MLRVLLVLWLAVVPLTAAAGTPDPGSPGPAVSPRRDGGVIAGRLAAVDFQRSTIRVDSPARGSVSFEVMPSTSIQAKGAAYHTITDLRVGERVEVYSSVNGQRYMAQIIHILH